MQNLECRIGKMATVLDRACKTFSMRNSEDFHEMGMEFKAFKRQRHEVNFFLVNRVRF